MRVYLSSGLLTVKQLGDLVDIGFNGWEFIADGAKRLNSATLSLIQHAVSSCGLEVSIHAPFSDLNIASVNQPIWLETLRQIKETIALAAEYTYIFIVHPGYISPLATQCLDKAVSKNNDALRAIAQSAAEYGVKATIENMANVNGFLGRLPQEIEAMTKNSVGFTFDIGHANTTHSIESFLEMPVDHVHLHDNHGVTDEHLVLGEGSIDWNRTLNALRHYKGAFVIEAKNVDEGAQSLSYLKSTASRRAAELA
ncbi:MAG: sugar phosphate isomerase/epimerase [Euryarchaeota archaeon]|nr:sugar phosphate isomerase/epimerase [Euryarchaeota archaeon]